MMIELVITGATLVIAGWALGVQAHQRSVASKTLERYASSRHLRFVPPRGGAVRASPRVEGSKEEVDYVFDLYRLGDEVRTRVACAAPRGRAPVLSISQRGAFDWKSGAGRNAELRIDHAAFNEAYVVTNAAGEDAELLHRVVRPLLLLARRNSAWLRSDGRTVSLSWQGLESNPVVLDAARDVVVMVARFHRPEAPYR
jgi:hypothetical protein